MTAEGSEHTHDDDASRSGSTVDESVATAEAGSQVEGVHTPSGQAESGDSRLEQMPEVAGVGEPRVDRISADEPVPDSPPFT